MGIFKDSSEEADLRRAINSIARLAATVVSGRLEMQDLREVLDSQMADLRTMYDAVATKHGPRAPKKLLKESIEIATINCDGPRFMSATRQLMAEVLATLDRPL